MRRQEMQSDEPEPGAGGAQGDGAGQGEGSGDETQVDVVASPVLNRASDGSEPPPAPIPDERAVERVPAPAPVPASGPVLLVDRTDRRQLTRRDGRPTLAARMMLAEPQRTAALEEAVRMGEQFYLRSNTGAEIRQKYGEDLVLVVSPSTAYGYSPTHAIHLLFYHPVDIEEVPPGS